jgi:hypothetical protein
MVTRTTVNNHRGQCIDDDHGHEYGSNGVVTAELNGMRRAYHSGYDIQDDDQPSYKRNHAYRDII